MQPITRALGAAFASTALILGITATTANAAPAQIDSAVAPINWTPCAEDATAECGTLSLPINWDRPRGEKFDLAVARRKATDPAKRAGILLINPGGPGGSGVNFALGAKGYFSADLQARFDIIGFDPRGVARSQPVKCSLEKLQQAPSTNPADQAEFDALVRYNRELRDDCRQQTGAMFDHADTGAVIQDMDAIRRSLGERKINYYGISYGTLIGQQYAERYGDKIRAMVIDSNMDHSLDTRGFSVTEAVTAEDSFNEFVKWCDRTASCALHGKDVAKFWDGLLARADRGELHDPADPSFKLTAEMIIRSAFGAFYGPDWAPLANRLVELDAQKPTQVRASAGQAVNNPFPAVFCQDWHLPIKDFREYSRIHATELAIAPHMRGGPLGHSATMGCVGWPEKINNPQHRLDIDDAPTILMLNAAHDPATAYSWAVNAHRQSRDTTVLLTYEGWGHGVYTRSECTDQAVDGYLINLKAPKDGTRCAAVEPSATAARAATGERQIPVGPRPGVPGWFG